MTFGLANVCANCIYLLVKCGVFDISAVYDTVKLVCESLQKKLVCRSDAYI